MADDIVTRLRQEAAQCNASPCDCQCPNLIAAADEIERLRELCNDLHHDATCAELFCKLCGDGIREWEARRG